MNMKDFSLGLNKEEQISYIKQMLSSPIYERKRVIIVEGISDIKVYKKCFNEEKFDFFYTGNCLFLNDIFSDIKSNQFFIKRVIFIKDADFDNLMNITYEPPFFITDYHDLEMMFFADNNAINNILTSIHPSINIEDNKYFIDTLKKYSCVQYYNIKNDLKLTFKGFKIVNGNQELNNISSFENILAILKEKQPQEKKKIIDDIDIKIINLLYDQIDDLYNLIRGHDYTVLLVHYINTFIMQNSLCCKKITKYNIEIALSLLSPDYFRNTKLYNNINNWLLEN